MRGGHVSADGACRVRHIDVKGGEIEGLKKL